MCCSLPSENGVLSPGGLLGEKVLISEKALVLSATWDVQRPYGISWPFQESIYAADTLALLWIFQQFPFQSRVDNSLHGTIWNKVQEWKNFKLLEWPRAWPAAQSLLWLIVRKRGQVIHWHQPDYLSPEARGWPQGHFNHSLVTDWLHWNALT